VITVPVFRRARLDPIAALVTVLAAAVCFCVEYVLCVSAGSGPQPAILAAILALGTARRAKRGPGTRALFAVLSLPVIALAVALVASVFHLNRYLGAVVFTGGLFLSVWLRNFEGWLRALGGMIALPLVAILIVPGPGPGERTNVIVRIGLVACAGLLAYGCNALAAWFIGREATPAAEASASGVAPRPKRPGPSISTRMAAQMGVAIALAFVAGFVIFPGHWGWTVLTAFIVCNGALGRGDALYKAVLRFIGAIGGTALATFATALWLPSGPLEAGAIFTILFAGLLLRDRNYAYWAACTTLILALLSRTGDAPALALLGVRLEAIFAGALCAVAATWLVFPIRTDAVVRRRLADALKAFDDLVVHPEHGDAEHARRSAAFAAALENLDGVAPPVVWHRRIVRRSATDDHPATWIEYARRLRPPRIADEAQRGAIRRAIGRSRKAIGDHGKPEAAITVGAALDALHAALPPPD
jgi:hypothetical protein